MRINIVAEKGKVGETEPCALFKALGPLNHFPHQYSPSLYSLPRCSIEANKQKDLVHLGKGNMQVSLLLPNGNRLLKQPVLSHGVGKNILR